MKCWQWCNGGCFRDNEAQSSVNGFLASTLLFTIFQDSEVPSQRHSAFIISIDVLAILSLLSPLQVLTIVRPLSTRRRHSGNNSDGTPSCLALVTMKFGQNLPRNQVPEWASSYIDYKALKKLIKTAQTAVQLGHEPDLAGMQPEMVGPVVSKG